MRNLNRVILSLVAISVLVCIWIYGSRKVVKHEVLRIIENVS